MKKTTEILAMVMAGGKGERLFPLTFDRTKPSVPFGGKYRIIDFALSNLINSGIYAIYVLVQYKSQSLIEHIRTTWIREGLLPRHFITVVPPQMRAVKHWYRGTADSVYQNINLIYDFSPKLVAIFSADHIYRMNIKEMIDYHLRKKAKLTISVVPISIKEAAQLGVAYIDDNFRIKEFKEKQPIVQSQNKMVYVSMGNYIFDAEFLIDVLKEDASKNTSHDFGKDIIPYLVSKRKDIYAYDFSFNRIPSLKKYEEKYYWKDVGNIFNYFQSNMDLLGSTPKLDLNNESWPIYASNLNCSATYITDSNLKNCLIPEGNKIINSTIINSILGRCVVVEENCTIENSIIFDFCYIGKNSKIKNAIIDRFNIIEKNSVIGYEKKKEYYLDPSGIVVLKRAPRRAFGF